MNVNKHEAHLRIIFYFRAYVFDVDADGIYVTRTRYTLRGIYMTRVTFRVAGVYVVRFDIRVARVYRIYLISVDKICLFCSTILVRTVEEKKLS